MRARLIGSISDRLNNFESLKIKIIITYKNYSYISRIPHMKENHGLLRNFKNYYLINSTRNFFFPNLNRSRFTLRLVEFNDLIDQ